MIRAEWISLVAGGEGINQVPNQIPLLSDLNLNCRWHGYALVTPECATKALKMNVANRRISPTHVDYHCDIIRSGQWQHDNIMPIAFSWEGILLNGQHRLSAIQITGKTVVAFIHTYIRPEIYKFFDGPGTKARTLADVLSLTENSNRDVVQMASEYVRIEEALAKEKPTRPNRKLRPDEVEAAFDKHSDAIIWSLSNRYRHQRGVDRVSFRVAVCQLWEHDPEAAQKFLDSVSTPNGQIQQTRHLREWLLTVPGGTSGSAMAEQAYLRTVAAIRAYREGREIKILRPGGWHM